MKVKVHLYSQSNPVIVTDAINTYTKDGLYCVLRAADRVDKFPVQHIFRATEEL